MSRNSRLGYDGEAPIEQLLIKRGYKVHRPRAGNPNDKGDIIGLPLVISVKNWEKQSLPLWVDAMSTMCLIADKATGVVWHKRRGYGDPQDWFVTTNGRLFLPMLDLWVAQDK